MWTAWCLWTCFSLCCLPHKAAVKNKWAMVSRTRGSLADLFPELPASLNTSLVCHTSTLRIRSVKSKQCPLWSLFLLFSVSSLFLFTFSVHCTTMHSCIQIENVSDCWLLLFHNKLIYSVTNKIIFSCQVCFPFTSSLVSAPLFPSPFPSAQFRSLSNHS